MARFDVFGRFLICVFASFRCCYVFGDLLISRDPQVYDRCVMTWTSLDLSLETLSDMAARILTSRESSSICKNITLLRSGQRSGV